MEEPLDVNPPEETYLYRVPTGDSPPEDTRELRNGQLVGLAPEYLVPVPEEELPSVEELQFWEEYAANQRAQLHHSNPPDEDMVEGLLAAIRQVKENPSLRLGLINAYLDEVAGLQGTEFEAAIQRLEEARQESANWGP